MVRHRYLRPRRRKTKSQVVFQDALRVPNRVHLCCMGTRYLGLRWSCPKNRSAEVFYLDTRCPDAGWKKGPPMSARRVRPYAVAIYGKIYVMGLNIGLWGTEVCVDNSVLGEVLDPLLNEWKPLPTIPEKGNDLDVDTHAVINGGKQFVVHTGCSDSLHLFDVDGEKWSLFGDISDSTCQGFKTPCAVVDSIMYCFSRRVLAYDLVRQKWFSEPVKGLERTGVSPPSWDKNGYGSPESNCPKAFLVHIGNGKLCLVWYVECERTPMEVHCTKFRISEHGDGEEEHRLHAIIESSVVSTIDNANDVEDCLAL